jgi:hypothetical protein
MCELHNRNNSKAWLSLIKSFCTRCNFIHFPYMAFIKNSIGAKTGRLLPGNKRANSRAWRSFRKPLVINTRVQDYRISIMALIVMRGRPLEIRFR